MLNLEKNKHYLLACSFGPDSMALFDMLLKEGYKFSVAHVNYHLRKEANEEEQIEIVRSIVYDQIIASKEMSSRQIPAKFKIRESLPLTKNSKVDFNELKKEELTGEEINVDVSETNLSVSDINIYKSNNKIVKTRKK